MENNTLSLEHLETLSSADLIALADNYGIDIPDNLNRRFIIGELLEVAEELRQDAGDADDEMIEKAGDLENSWELPSTFNETQISIVLRNPAWAFVYWDISAGSLQRLKDSLQFSHFILRVSYFEDEDDVNPLVFFDVQISDADREQFILLEADRNYLRVDLAACFSDGTTDVLAVSRKIALPEKPEIFSKAFPGQDMDIPSILEISGLKKLLKLHYEKYRQSFVK